jgi:hypothetical protein
MVAADHDIVPSATEPRRISSLQNQFGISCVNRLCRTGLGIFLYANNRQVALKSKKLLVEFSYGIRLPMYVGTVAEGLWLRLEIKPLCLRWRMARC